MMYIGTVLPHFFLLILKTHTHIRNRVLYPTANDNLPIRYILRCLTYRFSFPPISYWMTAYNFTIFNAHFNVVFYSCCHFFHKDVCMLSDTQFFSFIIIFSIVIAIKLHCYRYPSPTTCMMLVEKQQTNEKSKWIWQRMKEKSTFDHKKKKKIAMRRVTRQ